MYIEGILDRINLTDSISEEGYIVLDGTLGEWLEHNSDIFLNWFASTATGGYLDLIGKEYGLLRLDNESDDLIDDSKLYFLFVRLAAHHRQMNNSLGRDAKLEEVLSTYQEPIPGARERVERVLKVMLTAWAAALLRQQAENMVLQLKEERKI